MKRGFTFSDTPKLFSILHQAGLEPIRVVGGDKLLCRRNRKEWFVKACSTEEELVYSQVFPTIEKARYRFQILVLPQAEQILPFVRKRKLLVLPHFKGDNFNAQWNESVSSVRGGRGISVGFAKEVVRLLMDLSLIRTASLKPFGLPRFDAKVWRESNLPTILADLKRAGLIESKVCELFTRLLDRPGLLKGSRPIFANGDFYPRNLLKLPRNRLTLLDWEAREDREKGSSLRSMRNSLLAPAELHLAFMYVHMWGNQNFQKMLRKSGLRSLGMSARKFDQAVVVRSLEQAHFWRKESSYLSGRMIDLALSAAEECVGR